MYLEFNLSRSPNVKFNDTFTLSVYHFLLVFNSNIWTTRLHNQVQVLTSELPCINLSRTLKVKSNGLDGITIHSVCFSVNVAIVTYGLTTIHLGDINLENPSYLFSFSCDSKLHMIGYCSKYWNSLAKCPYSLQR